MINGALLNALPVINIISPTNPNPTPKSNNINGTAFDLSQDLSSARKNHLEKIKPVTK